MDKKDAGRNSLCYSLRSYPLLSPNEDEHLYIDKPPEEAKRLKDFMRIRDEYFTEVPEDLKPKEIETKLFELKTLCRSKCERYESKKD